VSKRCCTAGRLSCVRLREPVSSKWRFRDNVAKTVDADIWLQQNFHRFHRDGLAARFSRPSHIRL
jgi:hypothetical protein